MTTPGENDNWTPTRLRARLAALKGLAPAPTCYVIWRATTRPDTAEMRGYELPGEAGRRGEQAFERWLARRGLAGAERLSVSVLVIREQLDTIGLVRECVLERRRGDVEGPYHGNVARVEFTGGGLEIRRFRALRDGRLSELPPENAAVPASPPDELLEEGFAGDDDVVRAHLGPGCVILDRRAPLPAEDLLGLSVIIRARRADGVEVACGVGWHGETGFAIAADFPRVGTSGPATPDLETEVATAIQTRGLVRHETRLDEHGFGVIARAPGQHALFRVRPENAVVEVVPYTPGRTEAANEDQRRWMTYAESYEARVILDSWREGPDGAIIVVTADPDNEAWRHLIDPDGVEVSRESGNDLGAAALFREALQPPAPPETAADPEPDPPAVSDMPDIEPPEGSVLALVRAWTRVTELLGEARAARDPMGGGAPRVPAAMLEPLAALTSPLTTLSASFSLASLHRLLELARSGAIAAEAFAASLDELTTRLRDELALTRIVALAPEPATADGEPPFGSLVERHFPAAAYDIEEARLCLAMRRSTAAVLHAMKVMRHGLRGVERLLATPRLTDLSWSHLIMTVRGASANHPELIEALVRVRRGWRAPGLMPADKYTEEEAETVLAAVASFMRTLAARLEENRGPPAD